MSISLKNRSLISISDYTPEEICHVLDIAEDFEKNPHQNLLNGRIIASLFFEPLLQSFAVSAVPGAAVSIFWVVILIVIYMVEILVAAIQAYVFTLLSAVYIQLVESE